MKALIKYQVWCLVALVGVGREQRHFGGHRACLGYGATPGVHLKISCAKCWYLWRTKQISIHIPGKSSWPVRRLCVPGTQIRSGITWIWWQLVDDALHGYRGSAAFVLHGKDRHSLGLRRPCLETLNNFSRACFVTWQLKRPILSEY